MLANPDTADFLIMHTCAMNDQPCTPEDRNRIVVAAMKRADYLRWLAAALLRTDDILIRKEAAAVILEMLKETQ